MGVVLLDAGGIKAGWDMMVSHMTISHMTISDVTQICPLKHLQLLMKLEEKDLHSHWFLLFLCNVHTLVSSSERPDLISM